MNVIKKLRLDCQLNSLLLGEAKRRTQRVTKPANSGSGLVISFFLLFLCGFLLYFSVSVWLTNSCVIVLVDDFLCYCVGWRFLLFVFVYF